MSFVDEKSQIYYYEHGTHVDCEIRVKYSTNGKWYCGSSTMLIANGHAGGPWEQGDGYESDVEALLHEINYNMRFIQGTMTMHDATERHQVEGRRMIAWLESLKQSKLF